MKNPRRRKISGVFFLILLLSSIAILDLSRRFLQGDFETSTLELDILYSSEKASWLEEVTPIFEEQYQASNGKDVRVIINPIGSGKGTISVAREAIKPVVWSPASRFWLSTLNYLWMQENDEPVADQTSQALVISPTVIATWKSYQEQHNITGFQDLHQLALTDTDFTYAHTDPSRSNSGFGGVIMQAAVAAAKSPEELTLNDLADPDVQKWMRELEARAVEYGSSTGFLGKLLQNGGPAKLKVALLYENLIVEKNRGIEEFGYNDTLVAVYPKDGTVLNDHPYAILDAPWVSEEQKAVARDYLDFLLQPEIQEIAIQNGFRPPSNVNVNPAIEEAVFNPQVGVLPTLENITIYSIANIPGEILQRIPDLWSATRALGSSENIQGLTLQDFIFPAVIFAVMIIMVTYPLIQIMRRRFS